MVATDNWDSILSAFGEDSHEVGKEYTVGYRGEQLPIAASDQADISQDWLFFQETVQPQESF
jgi:hypothetical protein